MTNHAELTKIPQEEMERVNGGTATGKMYVATNVGVFVDVDSQGKLLIGTDGGIW